MDYPFDFGSQKINQIIYKALNAGNCKIAYDINKKIGVMYKSKLDGNIYWFYPAFNKSGDVLPSWESLVQAVNSEAAYPYDVGMAILKMSSTITEMITGMRTLITKN